MRAEMEGILYCIYSMGSGRMRPDGYGSRTRDPNLGKVMLYQLSYFRIFSFAVAKVGIFRKPANILHTFFKEICSPCTRCKTINLIINSFGHDNLHKKIACIFQLSPLWSR